ncbi:MAG: hypothetical protein JXB47_20875 [Anaerolineae bacterium]|nr:hypothetical protein [Anaerolineae bacterium]
MTPGDPRFHPLYVAATMAQSELARLRRLGCPVWPGLVERLERARRLFKARTPEPDLSLFENALRDVEVDDR